MDKVGHSDIVSFFLGNFWKLLIVFAVFGTAGYLLAALMRPAYRADSLVMPVHNTSNGLLAGLAGQAALGALGITQPVDKNEPLEIVSSNSLLRRFIDEHSLLPILCDAHAIPCNSGRAGDLLEKEHRMNSAIDLFQKQSLSVSENTITGVVRVSVIWYDRRLAAEWCNDLIDLTNKVIQERAEDLAAMRVKYLEQQYAKTSVVPLQQAVTAILVNEMTKQMDAATQSEYAWRVINRASAPDDRYPARPLKMVIAAAMGLAGVLIYLLIVQLRVWAEKLNQRRIQHGRVS